MKTDLYTISCLLLLLTSVFFITTNFFLATALRFLRKFYGSKEIIPATPQSFTIIIPAYNEEKGITSKIETLCNALGRVKCDVEVIIGSDGSTDRTVELAGELLRKINNPNWQLVEFVNEGKCKTLNKLVELARGEVIISTDADIPLPENSIELVVQAFQSSSRIGCLSCIPCFKGLDIGSQKSYWSVEDQIRRAESDLGKLIVVTGMLYAYKKSLFEEIPEGVMADDLWIPLNVLLKDYDSIQVNELFVPYEKTDEDTEIMRRKRVIVGGMDVVRRLWSLLATKPSLFALVFFHKINRWVLPIWSLLFVVATIGLWPWFSLVYVLLALLGLIILGWNKFNGLAYAGVSPILSFAEVLRKKDFARWEHTRKH